MNKEGDDLRIQGTAEGKPLSRPEPDRPVDSAQAGI
jgi:hypothetical protein